jgi:predicted AlkP superfamily pyrophosphatase or phosphodiesterase
MIRRAQPAMLLAALAVLACALALVDMARGQAGTPLVVMISVDGLRPDYITAADTRGAKVPHMRRFLKEGSFAEGVEGVIPTVTYPSHTTLVTGVSPAKHGVFNNLTFDPLRGNQSGWYWYAEDIRVPTLWDAAARAGWTTASVQWPATVGARITWNIPEFWRAGTPDDGKLLRATSTPGLLAELEADLGPYPRAFGVEADELRGRFAERLLEKKRPGLLLLHVIELDHVQHETGPFTPAALAVLERLDTVIGSLRATAERFAPGRAYVAIVSDHGFARTDMQLNLFAAFRAAGLFTVGDRGRVTDWTAMPWTSGGAAAIVLKRPADAAAQSQVRLLLEKLAADPANGIDRVLDADGLQRRGGFPPASFLVGLKPGWEMASSLTGPVLSKRAAGVGGTHGHLPDLPDLRAAFFLVGPGVPAGRSLGLIDMRDVAPTLASRAGLALPGAEGKALLP